MRLSLAFVALLAAVPTLSSVVPVPKGDIRMLLKKRASALVDEQGIVQPNAVARQIATASSKINRGVRAYEMNTGKLVSSPYLTVQARDEGSDPLTDDNESMWHGTISVGTPLKEFTVDFDTGSSDTFLPGGTCGSTCRGHKIYDTSKSSTARDQHQSVKLGYGDGSTVQASLFTDTVSIAGLTATEQTVGAATRYSSGFESPDYPADGLMGMAFSEISEFRSTTVFETLIEQGQVTRPQFSFKLASEGSELYLGGTNPDLYRGDFVYTKVLQRGFWTVELDAVSIDDRPIARRRGAIIDTGTTLIVVPQQDAVNLYRTIPGAKDASDLGEGMFSVPCDDIPEINLTFGGTAFPIPPEMMNIGQVSPGSSDCVSAIVGSESMQFWVVGDTFLRTVYTTFDLGGMRVGFAELR